MNFVKKLFFVLAIVAFVLPLSAWATVRNVPAQYSTIQTGIDSCLNGDTVLVHPGIYIENISFNGRNLVLGSLYLTTGNIDYVPQTVIDGDSSGVVVTFSNNEDSTSKIIGLTIKNGFSNQGGGVVCVNSRPQVLSNIIIGNVASDYWEGRGGAIYCSNADVRIENNKIRENTTSGYGAGIYLTYSNAIIVNNNISENFSSGMGGGICCENSNPTIIDNLISGNHTVNEGGGILCRNNSNPTITNNTIDNNTSDYYGGGIECISLSSPIISNNVITHNRAQYQSGGGILCSQSSPEIVGNLISENSATTAAGIECEYSSAFIHNNTITRNQALSIGGLNLYISDVMILNCIIYNNPDPYGYELNVAFCSPNIRYCDIKGGYGGQGNIDCDPLFCNPDSGNYLLLDTSCCIGVGLGGTNIGASGIGCRTPCTYVQGDINGDGSRNGSDVIYGVRYLKAIGYPPPESCFIDSSNEYLYPAADVDGDCQFGGDDITCLVRYFKGLQLLNFCRFFPPAPLREVNKNNDQMISR